MTTVLRSESMTENQWLYPRSWGWIESLENHSRHWRHCRGYYHFEVRLWFWTVNRQRFYIEWPARTTPCAFDFSMLFKSANFIYSRCRACETCGIVHFYRHNNLGLDVLTWTNILTCILSLYHVKFNRIMSIVLQIWLQAVAEWLARRLLNLQFTGSNTGGATWSTRNNLEQVIHSQLLRPTKPVILSGSIN